VARDAGPGGHGGAAGHGRARARHLPHRRGLLVRRHRSRTAPGGARALQPRVGRADPARPRLIIAVPAGTRMMTALMADFLTGYVVPAGPGLAGDPGPKASQPAAADRRPR